MQVARVQSDISDTGEIMVKNRSSVFDLRDSLNNIEVFISVVVLGQVSQIWGSIKVFSDIHEGVFVQTDVMVSYSPNNREHIANLEEDSLDITEIVVPSVKASIHVIVISYVTADEKHIRVQVAHHLVEQL